MVYLKYAFVVLTLLPVTVGCTKTETPKPVKEKTPPVEQPEEVKIKQKTCPVMGNPINPDVFVEYKGRKVYFCCPGCDKTFLADPEKYIKAVDAEISGKTKAEPAPGNIEQKLCPVMGNRINPDVYTDYLGKRIYFCCPPCIATFKADPEKYLKKMASAKAK